MMEANMLATRQGNKILENDMKYLENGASHCNVDTVQAGHRYCKSTAQTYLWGMATCGSPSK